MVPLLVGMIIRVFQLLVSVLSWSCGLWSWSCKDGLVYITDSRCSKHSYRRRNV